MVFPDRNQPQPLQPKPLQEVSPNPPVQLQPRWKVGIDRRQVAVFVGIAIIGGFAFGFATARFLTTEPPPSISERASQRAATNAEPNQTPELEPTRTGRVTGIIRADIVEVEGVGQVKLIGVDTPDGKPQYTQHGTNARTFTEKSLNGQEVTVEFDPAYQAAGNKDQSGQIVAYVKMRDGTNFNGEVIRQGYAFVKVSENFREIDEFRTLEREAMQEMRGVWGLSSGSGSSSTASSSSSGRERGRLSALPPSELGPNVPAISGSSSGTSASPGEAVVLFSPGEKIYHKSGCELLPRRRQSIPLSTARSQGFTACGRCYASTVLRAP